MSLALFTPKLTHTCTYKTRVTVMQTISMVNNAQWI